MPARSPSVLATCSRPLRCIPSGTGAPMASARSGNRMPPVPSSRMTGSAAKCGPTVLKGRSRPRRGGAPDGEPAKRAGGYTYGRLGDLRRSWRVPRLRNIDWVKREQTRRSRIAVVNTGPRRTNVDRSRAICGADTGTGRVGRTAPASSSRKPCSVQRTARDANDTAAAAPKLGCSTLSPERTESGVDPRIESGKLPLDGRRREASAAAAVQGKGTARSPRSGQLEPKREAWDHSANWNVGPQWEGVAKRAGQECLLL
jgi:hypothetical protein